MLELLASCFRRGLQIAQKFLEGVFDTQHIATRSLAIVVLTVSKHELTTG